MRAVVQRVRRASVDVGDERVAEIGHGLLVLLGVHTGDTAAEGRQLAAKIANLRIFADEAGKMNLSALDLGLEILVVSQFTLYGDVRKGRRPSFVTAAPPDIASPLVDLVAAECRAFGLAVSTGVFGAEMQIGLVNDGPVTIWIDTTNLPR
ncbi:MAG TPA: D-aminoacyl-tRNA deacylase [Thermomicrobiales bacterium]|jgi:D-tyrosyl-tRNA(Tyr) deacylase|nr:D-tyrosyl-tRNA(Tyr) deacylase [Chloroflexota bacterium]HQZ88611.1 D-aminoacyl-tRNA deacylase [Thermomicrobiales bacterium]HRA32411.1 D-aminoacyl-tRNA deacylase [Thermomicrobiales bacterium]